MKSMQDTLAKAVKDKQWELIKKDKIVAELTDVIIRQGVSFEVTKKRAGRGSMGEGQSESKACEAKG